MRQRGNPLSFIFGAMNTFPPLPEHFFLRVYHAFVVPPYLSSLSLFTDHHPPAALNQILASNELQLLTGIRPRPFLHRKGTSVINLGARSLALLFGLGDGRTTSDFGEGEQQRQKVVRELVVCAFVRKHGHSRIP